MKESGSWMAVELVLLVAGAYLLGSIPTSYLASRWLRGLDLRQYGSGTVSGSMVFEHVARWAIVPVGLVDIGKAALPAWLAMHWDLGLPVAALAGLSAAAGHNWPLFLGLTGGRGLACFLGLLVVVFPWGFPWLVSFLAVGWLLGDSAPWALGGLATLPLAAQVLDGPSVMGPIAVGMILLTLIKRLEANRRPLPPTGPERRRVVARRLLLDRDIADHAEWIHREPEGATQG